MTRFLSYFNFVGVAALAVLCAVQWQANSRLDQHAKTLDATRQEQAEKLAEQDKTLKANAADLDDLHQRLSKSEGALNDVQTRLKTMTAERDELAARQEELKGALIKWEAAVSGRDQALKQAGEQLQKLSADRNEAVNKFNDLVAKYNQAVKELNARGQSGQ